MPGTFAGPGTICSGGTTTPHRWAARPRAESGI